LNDFVCPDQKLHRPAAGIGYIDLFAAGIPGSLVNLDGNAVPVDPGDLSFRRSGVKARNNGKAGKYS